jgi:hypothetical protein
MTTFCSERPKENDKYLFQINACKRLRNLTHLNRTAIKKVQAKKTAKKTGLNPRAVRGILS